MMACIYCGAGGGNHASYCRAKNAMYPASMASAAKAGISPYAASEYPTATRTLFWGIDLLIAAQAKGESTYEGKSVYRFDRLVFHVIEGQNEFHFSTPELYPFIKISIQMGDRHPIVDIPASRFSEGGLAFQTDTLNHQNTILTVHNTFDKPLRVVGYFEGVTAQP